MTVATIPLTGQAELGDGSTVNPDGKRFAVTLKPARAMLASDGTVLVPAQAFTVTCDDMGMIPDGTVVVPSDADATETVPYFVQELFGDFRSGYVAPLTADATFNLFAADYQGYIPPDVPTELATQAALEAETADRIAAVDTLTAAQTAEADDREAGDAANAAAVVTERNRAVSTEADLQGQITALPTTDDVAAAVLAEQTRAEGIEAAKADLVGGKVPTSQLPAIPTFTTHPAASQAAMLALTAATGDVAIRTDLGNQRFLLLEQPPSTLINWISATDPTAAVDSVNGHVGPVVLGYADVGADQAGAADTARTTAISTAAADATTKASNAQTAAATDATNKVAAELTARNAAIAAAITALALPTTYQPLNLEGLLAARPAANTVPAKTVYFATDDNGGKMYRSNGTVWTAVSPGVTELPGSAPLGIAKSTSAFTTTAVYPTFVDVTGYTGVAVTYPASGVVEAKITPAMSHSVAGKLAVFQVVDASNVVQWDGVALSAIATGSTAPTPPAKELTGTPGTSVVLRLQVCGNSAGTVTVGNGISKFGGALKVTASG